MITGTNIILVLVALLPLSLLLDVLSFCSRTVPKFLQHPSTKETSVKKISDYDVLAPALKELEYFGLINLGSNNQKKFAVQGKRQAEHKPNPSSSDAHAA
jgi:hypothetical protein